MTSTSIQAGLPQYEVHAIRYATRCGKRSNHFIGGDPHDAPMPMDYYLWLIRGAGRTVVVDTGFGAEVATKRGRTLLRTPAEGLALLDVDAASVKDVVITHLHYDHVGTFDEFAGARFHIQDDEMAFATGRYMCCDRFSRPYEVDHVVGFVRLVYQDRVEFHRGDAEIGPGISVHRIGGHTAGLQCVRVHTARGWVVLASDASHYYEHFEQERCFPLVYHVGEMLEGFRRLRELADSPAHVVPGHDPLVMERYSAPEPQLEGIAVRLDWPPRTPK